MTTEIKFVNAGDARDLIVRALNGEVIGTMDERDDGGWNARVSLNGDTEELIVSVVYNDAGELEWF